MNCQSESPPPNARCYKETFFDEAFAACDFNIDSKKHAPFKSYFWDEFLITEQQKSCDYHEGEYDPETRECTVAVSYRYLIAGIKTTGGGCGQSRTLSVKLGGRPIACTRERFALPECNLVNEQIEKQRKDQEIAGTISLVTGAVGMGLGIISSANIGASKTPKTDTNTAIDADVKRIENVRDDALRGKPPDQQEQIRKSYDAQITTITEKKDYTTNSKTEEVGWGKHILTGWEAGGNQLAAGASGLWSASIIDPTGQYATGKCTTADGIEVLEPNTIFLDR
jgi:hypothetical protein